ncbi:MAG: metallophosphoesterase [Bacteroidota bacterium]
MRYFVMGDIHGAFSALKQCLQRSSFNYDDDTLICLGDVCDGWPQTYECVEELLKIKHLIFILGNHDYWTLQWAEHDELNPSWLTHGGENTIRSYKEGMPASHLELLSNAPLYHKHQNKLFVHAGINKLLPVEDQGQEILLWDRSLFYEAMDNFKEGIETPITDFEEIYIGHTPIHNYNLTTPTRSGEVWFMDTGAAWTGVLSIMNIETKEFFTSDLVDTLYPRGSGRV